MTIIIFFPEAELHFFAQFLHLFIFQNNKNLIGWGINAFGGNQELIHFYNMHGHNFVGVNDYDTISKAQTDYFNIPCWPKEGSIVETDEYIIVSFGNEENQ